jgi:hypothetical protein
LRAPGGEEEMTRVTSIHPAPHTLRPTPSDLHPAPCTLRPAPYTLHPTPHTLHPAPCTLHPTPCTLHPTPYTLLSTPFTLQPTPYTLNPKPGGKEETSRGASIHLGITSESVRLSARACQIRQGVFKRRIRSWVVRRPWLSRTLNPHLLISTTKGPMCGGNHFRERALVCPRLSRLWRQQMGTCSTGVPRTQETAPPPLGPP